MMVYPATKILTIKIITEDFFARVKATAIVPLTALAVALATTTLVVSHSESMERMAGQVS
jgi:hypothetical protein